MTMHNAALESTLAPSALADRAQMTHAFEIVGNVIEKRNHTPVLANARLLGDGTALFVTGSDLDIEITVSVPAAADSRFAVTLDAHKMKDILKKASASDFVGLAMPGVRTVGATSHNEEYEEFEDGIPVDFERVKYDLKGLPASHFPEAPSEIKNPHRFTLPGALFHDALQSVMGAVSTEETRYYLNGIYCHVLAGEFIMVASDGHRLYRRVFSAPDGAADMPGVILPRKTVSLLHKLTKGKNCPSEIDIEVTGTGVRFGFPAGTLHVTITSKVVDGTFPDYQRVIPMHNDKPATFEADGLAEVVRAVSLISSERGRAVKFDLSAGNCRVTVNNPDAGSAEADAACNYTSDSLEIGFNAIYLAEMLPIACPDGGDVTAMFNGPGDPTIFSGAREGWTAVLMPIRI